MNDLSKMRECLHIWRRRSKKKALFLEIFEGLGKPSSTRNYSLAQKNEAEKTNKFAAIPALLEWINLKENIVSINSIGMRI